MLGCFFAKIIGMNYDIAAKLARIFRAKTAKMARTFHFKTAKMARIKIFLMNFLVDICELYSCYCDACNNHA